MGYNIIGPVTLKDEYRREWKYESIEDFFNHHHWNFLFSIGERFYTGKDRESSSQHNDHYILLNSCGLILPQWKILEQGLHNSRILSQKRKEKWYSLKNGKNNIPVFRRDPIKGSSYGRHYGLRNFRHVGELRALKALKTEEDCKRWNIAARGKRINRPEPWDDIQRESCYHKNWKCFRKTQYKP